MTWTRTGILLGCPRCGACTLLEEEGHENSAHLMKPHTQGQITAPALRIGRHEDVRVAVAAADRPICAASAQEVVLLPAATWQALREGLARVEPDAGHLRDLVGL